MPARIWGVNRLRRKLDGEKYRRRIRQGIERALLLIHGSLPGYPPPRPRQRYRRTGTLGKSITTRVEEQGRRVIGIIGTKLRYAPWVISERKTADGRGPQAWMHAGRWWTLQKEVASRKADVIRIIRESIMEG